MIKLYGILQSRAARPMWMLEELGVEYELVPTSFRDGSAKAPEYLALNPNGRIPTLVDGDTVLFESMAINLYLADTYDGGLKPDSPVSQAKAVQWSFWAMTELEGLLMTALSNRVLRDEKDRDEDKAAEAQQSLGRPLKVLDGALGQHEHLLGKAFSVADLNVASLLTWAKFSRIPLAPFPNVERWLNAAFDREAYRRLYAK